MVETFLDRAECKTDHEIHLQRRTTRTWSSDDDSTLLGLKASGSNWKQISEQLEVPCTTCRERYNKLMKKAVTWDKQMDEKLERAYQRHREQMWKNVANDIGIPWRAAEDRMWDLGKKKFVKR